MGNMHSLKLKIMTIKNHLNNDRKAQFGLGIIILMVFFALTADFITPYDPFSQDLTKRLRPPSIEHPFGLDEFGRDLFSRVIYGARISMFVAVATVILALLIAVPLGILSGYFGGKLDMVVMRLADVFLAFPGLILAIGFVAVLGQSLINLVISLAIVNWPGYARVVRAQTLQVKTMEYIEAAIVMGASNRFIMYSHILPNTISSLVVLVTLGMGWAVLSEAGLSFLGLGVKPPTPSWGAIISSGRTYLLQAPHITIFSGLFLALTILAFNLVGESLRDALDPRMRK